jgi:phage baseplate assembly protein W
MSIQSNLYQTVVLPPVHSTPHPMTKIYRGFSTISAETENFNLYDMALVKQDLLNHFNIRQGERLMQPTFGTIIWDLIFEPLTEQVKSLILQNVNNIVNYDPRLSVEQVTVTSYETGIQIECKLNYLMYNISEVLKLRFDQTTGLMAR